jgi:hypothetical protein
MFIMIGVLIVLIVIILFKMGPVGRFFLAINTMPGPKTILIAQTHTNELKFMRCSDRGRSLRVKKDMYMFLPDFIRSPKDDDERTFNDLLKKPAHIDGKAVYMGAASVSVASNPHLMDAISKATEANKDEDGKIIKEDYFLDTLHDGLKATLGKNAIVKKLYILNPFSVQKLAELMNVVITPQRMEDVWNEGHLAGLNRYKQRDMILLGAILILTLGMVIMGYWLQRG